MSDLTVLVSPTPLYPKQHSLGFNFARRSQNDLTRPVMVILENVDRGEDTPPSPIEVSSLNAALLSPPRRTYKASRSPSIQRPASAPPLSRSPTAQESHGTPPTADVPKRVFSSSTPTDRSELSRPPPPLFRPTTFWRKTKRSGVASASYSPSSHLIRRSTFIAAGLSLDKPQADLSALGVESRVKLIVLGPDYNPQSIAPFNPVTHNVRTGVVSRYRSNQAISSASSALLDVRRSYSITFPTAPPNTDSDALSSDIPFPSLIQITALPPATSSSQAVIPKLPYHPQVNILYLAPLFIALGVVIGAVIATTLLKWRESRRRLLRTSSLLPGPPYAPPENDVEDRLLVHGYQSIEQVSLFAASTPSKFTVHGSRYMPRRLSAWQALDHSRETYSHSTYAETIIPSSDGERFTVITQDDPFLVSSNSLVIRTLSHDGSVPTIHILPSLPEPDEPSHEPTQDTRLSKPFRRSMFDLLKRRGSYRSLLNVRSEYDVPVDRTSVGQVRRVSSLKETLHTGQSRLRRARHSLDNGFHVGKAESAPGFQDSKQCLDGHAVVAPERSNLLEDMDSATFRSESIGGPRELTPSAQQRADPEATYIKPTDGKTDDEKLSDTHSRAPCRRRRSETPGKSKSNSDVSRRSSAPDFHASVLPLGPPSLMSPPLEKTLFFTSPIASSTSLVARMSSIDILPLGSPETSLFPLPTKTKALKKPQICLPESPLPSPSYPDLGHAQPTRSNSDSQLSSPPSLSPTRREGTVDSSLGPLSPTSFAIALAASSSLDMLSKVNEIVTQGYINRQASMKG